MELATLTAVPKAARGRGGGGGGGREACLGDRKGTCGSPGDMEHPGALT
jgi:hypothetical protein